MCILPVRCYTCGKVIGGKWTPYQNLLNEGVEMKEALDRLELKRICCRRMMMGHVELIDSLLKYSDSKQDVLSANIIT
jgi:DNA-directed RNA polymerase I, II, and III subunit RPABC5